MKEDELLNSALFEDKFARTYAEIRRLDELRRADAEAQERLIVERVLRLDERMDARESAIERVLADIRDRISANVTAIQDLRSRVDIGPASLAALQTRADENVGRAGQSTDSRSIVFGSIAAAAALVAIVAVIVALAHRGAVTTPPTVTVTVPSQ